MVAELISISWPWTQILPPWPGPPAGRPPEGCQASTWGHEASLQRGCLLGPALRYLWSSLTPSLISYSGISCCVSSLPEHHGCFCSRFCGEAWASARCFCSGSLMGLLQVTAALTSPWGCPLFRLLSRLSLWGFTVLCWVTRPCSRQVISGPLAFHVLFHAGFPSQ